MSKKFDRLLEKATDGTLLEADWELIMNCVDQIRSGEVSAKVAIASIIKRMQMDNPHVAHHALTVLEALVKNCGQKVHKEVATKEFMEFLKHSTNSCPEKVKDKILELIQCWAHAFRDNPEYRIVKDTHNLMKLEGYAYFCQLLLNVNYVGHVFPVLRESDAMFMSEAAPDWVDADHCFRCSVQFTLINRKHHCRNCGQIFCDKCSGRYIALPHIGIEREVRVCETCFDRIKNPSTEAKKVSSAGSQEVAKKSNAEQEKMEAEIREAEEISLALALSKSEAEEKERQKHSWFVPKSSSSTVEQEKTYGDKESYYSVFNGVSDTRDFAHSNEAESELARYLNRQYWDQVSTEQKHQVNRVWPPSPSAPVAGSDIDSVSEKETTSTSNGPVGSDANSEEFLNLLNERLSAFVNRLKSNRARGRSVVGESALQAAFMNLTTMHSQLLKHLKELDDKRGYYENLQDKLQQVRDAREAVDALRLEHEQKKRAALYEMQQARHVQMLAKLEAMRIKKHEMLEHQRLAAIKKMEDEQRELEARKRFIGLQSPVAQQPPVAHQLQVTQQPPVAQQMPVTQAYGSASVAQPFAQVQQAAFPSDYNLQQQAYHPVVAASNFTNVRPPPMAYPCATLNYPDQQQQQQQPQAALVGQADSYHQYGMMPMATQAYGQSAYAMAPGYSHPPQEMQSHYGYGNFAGPQMIHSTAPYAYPMRVPPAVGYVSSPSQVAPPQFRQMTSGGTVQAPPGGGVNYATGQQAADLPPSGAEQPAEGQLITFD